MSAFLALHVPGEPLVCPNPWDAGSAVRLAALGFRALATTSSGFAASLGREDGEPSRDEVLAHARALVAAVEVPVTADLEDGYAEDAGAVGATIARAAGVGLAGGSIEDWDGARIRPRDVAVERVEAAVAAAPEGFVVTARAENHVRGVDDLADTVARLEAFAAAGAHVLYAPGLVEIEQIRTVVEAVAPRPVNVLLRPRGPSVSELAAVGVARVTVGGAFAFTAYGALERAALALRDRGVVG
jgi:2-methylisocitrate lyase-like PEP mutase family enzyme